MSQGSGKRKRETNPNGIVDLPKSLLSYLMGALRTNFAHLKEVLIEKHELEFRPQLTQSSDFWDQLLEEMIRYLYLLGVNFAGNIPGVSPSGMVDKALHCLILDPVMYYDVCDEILTMHGVNSDAYSRRVLPHNSLGGKDVTERKSRYTKTLLEYSKTFKQMPPVLMWNDYQPAALVSITKVTAASSTAISPQGKVFNIWVGHEIFGDEVFRVERDTKMSEIFAAYAERLSMPTSALKFITKTKFNKKIIVNATDTPHCLGLQENDHIFAETISLANVNRPITIRCRDMITRKLLNTYKMRSGASFASLFEDVASRKGVNSNNLRFMFANKRLSHADTPIKWEMEDDDEIEVILERTGC